MSFNDNAPTARHRRNPLSATLRRTKLVRTQADPEKITAITDTERTRIQERINYLSDMLNQMNVRHTNMDSLRKQLPEGPWLK